MTQNPDGTLASFIELEWRELQKRYARRQDLPLAYAENGAIFLVKRMILLELHSFYSQKLFGYEMPPERSLDIDTPWDFDLVDLILQNRNKHENS
jgi:N-acylneuraminate cytidylyltransferase/CMP-N,N'-diacetyllegionaminic acid synthase